MAAVPVSPPPEGDAARLGAEALGALMPLFLRLDAPGRIVALGPTLARLFPQGLPLGQPFFDHFAVRRPGGIAAPPDLARRAGTRLTVVQRGGAGLALAGLAVPVEGGGLIINLSFGIGVIDAVRTLGLTAADFTATDLAMELLYLVEAKSAVTEELRALNLRLQGAKRTAEAQAMTDMLTGLQNRRALDLTMADAVSGQVPFGLMHIDLDYFKAVNDTLGHAAGDHVLREVARVLREETRRDDTVARIGGDEFVVVFPGLTDQGALATIAERIVARLSEPFLHEGHLCRISASIGMSVSTAYDILSADAILGDADEATYASKHAGRGRALFHDRVQGDARPAPARPAPDA
jgi:diguanylate cyclase (GGDEF)-like protein